MDKSASWASVANVRPSIPSTNQPPVATVIGESCAVLDASAIIGGSCISDYAETILTTPDVFAEIRDKQSRQLLSASPFGFRIQEPSEASVAAVTKFARATGEIHSLSTADVRLIALAHTLHTAHHGCDSLHAEPALAKSMKAGRKDNRHISGWGVSGGQWEEMDELEEAELAAYEKAYGASAASRIASDINSLSLNGIAVQLQQQQLLSKGEAAAPPIESQPAIEQAQSGSDEDAWELARASQAAVRRSRRKQARKAARQEAAIVLKAEASPAAHDSAQKGTSGDTVLEQADWDHTSWGPKPINAAKQARQDADRMPSGATERQEKDPHQGDSKDSETDTAGGQADVSSQEQASVSIITADFAMQNVILQLGLQLVSPDGRQIRRISQWVLRCAACFKVTKEMERLFCPTCGNAALEKVELVVGEDGAEQYGVRKKHILRGTRYSLPKPKGGKKSTDPVLREDVLLQRMPRRKPEQTSTDPFAPDYNSATWYDTKGAAPSAYQKGLAATLALWKHNPNERRHTRTNRRK